MQRSRYLNTCKGCGSKFYTTSAEQLYCKDACKGKKLCHQCGRSKPIIAFQDRRGKEHDVCRDCCYLSEEARKHTACPDCGGAVETGRRCTACARIFYRKFVADGGDFVRTALDTFAAPDV